MTRPEQAVILCGGLGARLRPLTDTMPKPMAPVNGRPFLSYLLAQLRDQGVRRVLLLTGYRGEMIADYFGDGRALGIEIAYAQGPVDWDTGRRVWEARDRLDARFLLLYADNFTPFSLDKLLALHTARAAALSLTVCAKPRGNIRLDADGRVAIYDSSRSAPDLDYVEIGYMMVEREPMLAVFEAPDVSFSRILERLVRENQVAALVNGDAYHSISDPERWRLAEAYLRPKPILLIDRDGTINQRAPRGDYVTRWAAFRWIDETVEAMAHLAAAGFRFIVVSNQAGIARGVVDARTVGAINQAMVEHLNSQGIEVIDVYVCPHHWDDGCDCRKPAAGLFFRAARDHLLRLDHTIYVGDDPRDAEAADNARCESVLIGPERNIEPRGGVRPTFKAATLKDATPWIVSRFDAWAAAF